MCFYAAKCVQMAGVKAKCKAKANGRIGWQQR